MLAHSMYEIFKAFAEGLTVYYLDTDTSGGDDMLILGPGEAVEDLKTDVLYLYEKAQWPENWDLKPISFSEFALRCTHLKEADLQLKNVRQAVSGQWMANCPRSGHIHYFDSYGAATQIQWCQCCPLPS